VGGNRCLSRENARYVRSPLIFWILRHIVKQQLDFDTRTTYPFSAVMFLEVNE
jgi:hypothetical protein